MNGPKNICTIAYTINSCYGLSFKKKKPNQLYYVISDYCEFSMFYCYASFSIRGGTMYFSLFKMVFGNY